MRHCLSLMVLLLPLAGCERLDGDTVCEGRVLDRTTGALVLQPVTVGVYHTGNGSGGGYSLREEHQTDANGRFSFHIDSDANDLALRAYGAPGYSTWWQEMAFLRGGHNNKGIDLKVQSPAWVKVHVKLPNPADTATIRLWGDVSADLLFYGDTTTVCSVAGNNSNLIGWTIQSWLRYRPAVSGNVLRYCPALDTVPLEIRY